MSERERERGEGTKGNDERETERGKKREGEERKRVQPVILE